MRWLTLLIDVIVELFLVYLIIYFAQVSPLLAVLHFIILCGHSTYLMLELSERLMMSKTAFFVYTILAGVSVACCIFLAFINFILMMYTYPLIPFAFAIFYLGIACSMISSIFKIRLYTAVVAQRGRRCRYWSLKS